MRCSRDLHCWEALNFKPTQATVTNIKTTSRTSAHERTAFVLVSQCLVSSDIDRADRSHLIFDTFLAVQVHRWKIRFKVMVEWFFVNSSWKHNGRRQNNKTCRQEAKQQIHSYSVARIDGMHLQARQNTSLCLDADQLVTFFVENSVGLAGKPFVTTSTSWPASHYREKFWIISQKALEGFYWRLQSPIHCNVFRHKQKASGKDTGNQLTKHSIVT